VTREIREKGAIRSSTFRVRGSKFRIPRTADLEPSSVSLDSPVMSVPLRYWTGQIINLRYISTILSGSSHVVALNSERFNALQSTLRVSPRRDDGADGNVLQRLL
jgi:hypothetical protein